MTTAPFRITLSCEGKKPARRVIPLDNEDEAGAVFAALRWTMWSHAKGRPRKLSRYTAWKVEELRDGSWNLIREGTYTDAASQIGEENASEAEVSTISSRDIRGYERGFAPRTRANRRSPRGTSRLAQLVNRTLNGK